MILMHRIVQAKFHRIFATSLNEMSTVERALRQISMICSIFLGRRETDNSLELIKSHRNSLSCAAMPTDFSHFIKNPHFSSISTTSKKSRSAPSLVWLRMRKSSKKIRIRIPLFLSEATTGLRIFVTVQGADDKPKQRHDN